jgi:predicted P-loop ATPase
MSTISIARGRPDKFGVIVSQEALTLAAFADLLRQAQAIPTAFTFDEYQAATEEQRKQMKRAAWYTCGTFKGARRVRNELISCSAIVFDADKPGFTVDALDDLGCSYVAVTSTSHGVGGQACCRIVIPLAEPISADRYDAVWEQLASRVPGIDQRAKDAVRLNYMPHVPKGALGHEVVCVDDRPWLDAATFPESPAAPVQVATATREELSEEQIADTRAALLSLAAREVQAPDTVNWTNIGYALLKHGARDLWLEFCEAARGAKKDHGGEEWWARHATSAPRADFRHILKQAAALGWQNPHTVRVAAPEEFQVVGEAPARPPGELIEESKEGSESQKSKFAQRFNLQVNDRGKALSNAANVEKVLRAHNVLTYDEFRDQVLIHWPNETRRPWRDEDATRIQTWLQNRGGMVSTAKQSVIDVCDFIARDHRTNIITEWLLGLRWDGSRRLSTWLRYAFGVPADRYHIRVGRNMLIAMVARAMHPGCKVDESMVLEGAQGTRKTQALEIIGGEHFKELIARPGTKDFAQQLRGVWLGEFSELAAFKRPEDIEEIKQFLTCRVDHYRPSYGRVERDYPRRIVFCGSTNTDKWSHDSTGARRFNPVKVQNINLSWLRDNREQLFAEAVRLYQANRTWWTYPKLEAQEQRDARIVDDTWDYRVADFLKGRSSVFVIDVLETALGVDVKDQSRAQSTRVGVLLRKLGCEPERKRVDGERQPKTFWHVPKEYGAQPLAMSGPVQFEKTKEPSLTPANTFATIAMKTTDIEEAKNLALKALQSVVIARLDA